MNETELKLFDSHMASVNMSNIKKEDYCNRSMDLEQKQFLPWSPQESNRCSLKHQYITSSRSFPRRNKRFVHYKINRSLNFDGNQHNSSSDNSSCEGDKYLSRSAKIMRALNFNSSPTYYGKTKIKRSLNFNSTPSPKSFTRVKKNIPRTSSLNFNSPTPGPHKILTFDQSPNHSANSSLIFASPDSIDENQNETPSRQSAKSHKSLNYSTPNTAGRKSLSSASCSPLLRSGLKESIDNIVYITATPNQQPKKSAKNRLKFMNDIVMSTPRNLFHDFHDDDNDRPCTPENFIRIIPESMSAIKRSHKKERSRKNERSVVDLANTSESNGNLLPSTDYSSTPQMNRKFASNRHLTKDRSWDESMDNSDRTDSKMFDGYECAPEYDLIKLENAEELKWEGNESVDNLSEIETEAHDECIGIGDEPIDGNIDCRSITPDANIPEYNKVTPENHLNIPPQVLQGSIKKSHKKSKDDGKRKLFSPKVLLNSLEIDEQENSEHTSTRSENPENKVLTEAVPSILVTPKMNRALTPEKVNSSRLLLSEFSSVKKSHKKDKHNKMLSGFLKRQEYFNRDIDLAKNNEKMESSLGVCGYKSSSEDLTNFELASARINYAEKDKFSKLSPTKRKKLDVSLDPDPTSSFFSGALGTNNVSCEFELQDCDSSKEEFKIFTPLKRRRPVATSAVQEYSSFYHLLSGDVSEDSEIDVSSSRCITPVASFRRLKGTFNNPENNSLKTEDDDLASEILVLNNSNDLTTGRSTPRNMSTTELYFNIDSIKKSHKKNKRESSRIALDTIKNKFSVEDEKNQDLKDESIEVELNIEKSVDPSSSRSSNGVELILSNESPINTETIPANSNSDSNQTPPNCLKTKSYIKLLQQTSIKRSHKKARDQKKILIDTHELSDDGSIFGDEEKLASIEDENND